MVVLYFPFECHVVIHALSVPLERCNEGQHENLEKKMVMEVDGP